MVCHDCRILFRSELSELVGSSCSPFKTEESLIADCASDCTSSCADRRSAEVWNLRDYEGIDEGSLPPGIAVL